MSAPPKSSPWGKPDDVKQMAPGVWWVSTPSHGGIKLAPEVNRKVPDYMRRSDGWYEEDLDWAIVATVFPEIFSEEDRRAAEKTLLDWRPDQYERFYRVKLREGASRKRDEEIWLERHKNDWITMAAWGDWHPAVPKGHVVVFAGRGGRKPDGSYPTETAYFAVSEKEYESSPWAGFIVDPSRHEKVDFPE